MPSEKKGPGPRSWRTRADPFACARSKLPLPCTKLRAHVPRVGVNVPSRSVARTFIRKPEPASVTFAPWRPE